MLSAKDIGGWEFFDGADENWPTWSFSTKTALHELGRKPLLRVVEAAVGPIDPEHDVPN